MLPSQEAALDNQNRQNANDGTPPAGTGNGTSVEAFLSHYSRKMVTLPVSGHTVEIQALPPGDYLSIYGSAFNVMMTAAGLDHEDDSQRKHFQRQLTERQRMAIAESNLNNYRRIVAKAIVSVPVSMLEQHLCPEGVLSIFQIADPQILFLHKEVQTLSGWNADVDRFQGSVPDNKDE
ncbi:MAG: hypothetical protein OXI63_22040 [Candidatus Poribacteria bacterium]|nr:hypothetical protein [Candidatus Poribacteria bacterium]